MRLLVTGANGFIGKRLCEFLCEAGHDVRRSVRIAESQKATFELSEKSSPEELRAACIGIDCIIHLAAANSQTASDESECNDIFFSINVKFTLRLAEVASAANVKRFVYLSTIKVCGEESIGQPFNETAQVNPRGLYAESKWAAEQGLRELVLKNGLNLVIVRTPLIYGPGVQASFLTLLSAVSKGLPLPFKNLRSKRSLLYLENLMSALLACATDPAAEGQTFHVADAQSVSISEIINLMTVAGMKPRLFGVPNLLLRTSLSLLGRRRQLLPLMTSLEVDSSHIQNRLGWMQAYTVQQGIQSTARWYQNAATPPWPRSDQDVLKVCQLCAVDFTMQHLLLPLVKGLHDEGWSVTLACSDGPHLKNMREMGFRFRMVSISRSMWRIDAHLRAIFKIYKLCRNERIDVLHVHTPVAALVGRIGGRLAKVPHILYTAHGFYFHDEMPPWSYRLFVLLERWSGRLTDYLFTQSYEDATAAIAEKIMPKDKVLAIGNGVSKKIFCPNAQLKVRVRAELKIPEGAFVIGVVARFVREKGLIEFLEAAIALHNRFMHVYFIMVGERLSSERGTSIENKLDHAKQILGPRLLILGYRKDVAKLLGAMDLFCLPSYREGMPRSIIEAMMMGLPVVATNTRGSREEVVHGETGLLVPTKDATALAKALEELVSSPERARKMGEFGRLRATELYDEEQVIERQIAVIRNLTSRSRF